MNERFFNSWRIGLIGLFVISVLLYLPSLMGSLVWDDSGLVSGQMFGGNNWHSAWTHSFGNYFRPLTSVSFVLDSTYARAIPFYYHQTNILLHSLTTVLVACLTMLLSGKRFAAFVAGLFFATQPFQVGTTAWIGGRTDTLSTFFLALFLIGLVSYLQTSKLPWLVVSISAFLMAALSKEQAVAIFPIVPLSVFVFGTKKWRDARRLTMPFGIAFCLYMVVWLARSPVRHTVPTTFWESVTLPLRTLAFYGTGLLVPNRPALISFTLENYQGYVWICIGLVMTIACGYLLSLAWKSHRTLAWIAVCGLLVYLPVSNLPALPSLIVGSYRFGEAGIATACLLGILSCYCYSTRRVLLSTALAANLIWGAAITRLGMMDFMSPLSFFSSVAKNDPHFIEGVQFYSQILDSKGEHDEAIRISGNTLTWVFGSEDWVARLDRERMAFITPDVRRRLLANKGLPSIQSLGNFVGSYASYLARARRLPEARNAAKDALVLAPNDPWVNYLYGQLLFNIDRGQAIHYWEITMKLAPDYSACAVSLAHERARMKRYREAVTLLEQALKELSYSGNTWVDLADSEFGLGNLSGANSALDSAAKAMFPPDPLEIKKRRDRIKSFNRESIIPAIPTF